MIIKNIIEEDFTNYKRCSMFIGFPTCTFKCEKECRCTGMCQNSQLVKSPDLNISIDSIVSKYINNPISSAIVVGGLEPFDSFEQLLDLVTEFRKHSADDFVIYTGYYFEEIEDKIELLKQFKNIVVKFGRYIPNQESHYDDVLGINLASKNQYAERIC